MITAKEARQLYNETVLLRDKYIEEVIEPLIRKTAPASQSVTVDVIGGHSARSINFPEPYAQNGMNIALTDLVTKTLIESGYKIHYLGGFGTEKHYSEGKLIISWE